MVAVFAFFLGLLIHNQLSSPGGDLGQALIIFALVAVPGALLVAWLAGAGRRNR
ncbi:hypothetical protein ABZ705_26250 [Streptomyces sp. NPDC006984]|uniref:hypothetical protein n=1 Tax=Streptomyces sp. NPDC006984 TaxID=3155463 RepID=UPI0034033C57